MTLPDSPPEQFRQLAAVAWDKRTESEGGPTWTSCVENYPAGHLQVPAVILLTDSAVVCVPLQKHLYWTEIDLLST